MYRVIGGDQKEYGPVSADEVRSWIRDRRLNGGSFVRTEHDANWKPLSSFPELAGVFAENASATVAAPQFQTPGSTNPLAIAGLICGALAWCLMCCCYGLPFNVLGIVFSGVALAQLRHARGAEGGRGMALAGLVLSILQIVLFLVLLGFGVALNWSDIMRNLKR